jgi:hypothetical protein
MIDNRPQIERDISALMNKIDNLEKKIDEIDPPGHFFIILMLLVIMSHIGAC